MLIYIFISLFIIFAGMVIKPEKSDKRKKRFLVSVFIVLSLFSGFRSFSVGSDTSNYVRSYYAIQDGYTSRFEIGFVLYVRAIAAIFHSPRALICISSMICIGIACVIASNFSLNPTMSMALYVFMGNYFSQMNIMRQALAMSFIEIAYLSLLKSKGRIIQYIQSGIIILIAVQFHTVAIVGFMPYFLIIRKQNTIERNKTRKQASVIVASAVLIAAVAFAFYPMVMRVSNKLFPQYDSYFRTRWSDSNYNAAVFNTLIPTVFAIVGAFVYKGTRLNSIEEFAALMTCLTIIFESLSMRMEIWGRIAGIFGIFVYLIWAPNLTQYLRNKNNRHILEFAIYLGAFSYMMVVLIFRPEWSGVVPYAFG